MILVRSAPSSSSRLAHLAGQQGQIAGVQPDRTEPAPGQFDPDPHRVHHVVGVDQQGGALAHGRDLGCEGLALVAVQQGEGVRRGAGRGHAVAPAGLQIGGGGEAGDVGRPGRGDRGQFVGPPRSHLDARPVAGHRGHPGGGRGDRRVVVVDAEQQGLQDHRLGEARLDDHHRRAREIDLALGVAPDVPGEAVVGQPVQGVLVDHAAVAQEGQRLSIEPEMPQRPQRPADPGDHPVAPPVGQSAGEQFEDAPPIGRPRLPGRPQHGQLVVVGQQRGGRNLARSPAQILGGGHRGQPITRVGWTGPSAAAFGSRCGSEWAGAG